MKLNELGRIWEKGELKRLYIDRDAALACLGMEISRYRTGSVSWAAVDGTQISNSRASRILSGLEGIYYDIKRGRLMHRVESDDVDMERLADACREALQQERA